jgi:threonine/homoserine/homoserine lactone efflux protein
VSGTLAEFALTSLLIELTPGPNMAYLAALALSRGRHPALSAVAGVAVGLMLLGLLAAAGLQAVVIGSPLLYQTIRWAGIAYLLWLAWKTWQPAPQEDPGSAAEFASFRDGLVTNLLNPKAAMFYVVVMPRFVAEDETSPAMRLVLLALVHVAIATLIHVAIVLFAERLRPWLVARGGAAIVRRAMALALVLVAAWFAART